MFNGQIQWRLLKALATTIKASIELNQFSLEGESQKFDIYCGNHLKNSSFWFTNGLKVADQVFSVGSQWGELRILHFLIQNILTH